MYQVARTDKNPIVDNACQDLGLLSFQGAWDDCRELNGPEWAALASQEGFSEKVLETATYLPYQFFNVSEPVDGAHAYSGYSSADDSVEYFHDFETARNWTHAHGAFVVGCLIAVDYNERAKFNQSFIQE